MTREELSKDSKQSLINTLNEYLEDNNKKAIPKTTKLTKEELIDRIIAEATTKTPKDVAQHLNISEKHAREKLRTAAAKSLIKRSNPWRLTEEEFKVICE